MRSAALATIAVLLLAPLASAQTEPSSTSSTTSSGSGTTSATSGTAGSTTSSPPQQAQPAPPPPRSQTRTTSSQPRERVLQEDQDPDEASAEDEDEDSWGVFYLQGLAGYSFANLVQFNQDNFIPEAEELKGSGLFGGLGAGFRIYFLTLGAQATIASYFGFELGSVGLDVGLHLPVPLIEPYLRAGFGYAWMGDANYNDPAASETSVYGFYIDAGVGLDFKLARILSIGAGIDASFLNLGRQEISDAGTVGMINLEESGDSVGLQIRAHGHITLHI